MSSRVAQPMPVLVVASWFPSVDESTRGRFVADQVLALAASGRVVPQVVSFDTINLSGEAAGRHAQAAAVERLVGLAIARDDRVFSAQAMHGPPGIEVARIPVSTAPPGVSTDDPSRRRTVALRSVAPRLRPPSVIHAHTGFPDGAASIELAHRLDVPLVITEHATFVDAILADAPRRAAYLAAVEAASSFVAVSETLGRELCAAIPGLAEKLVVIPNAVDVETFRPAPASERHEDELLYVGYRIERKGIPVLLEAFDLVRRERPRATLRLIGRSVDQETEDGWLRIARDRGLGNAVRFEPPALRPAVAEAMAHASVLVHASTRETFGMTAAEALAAGTPVVAADSGGMTETVGSDPSLGAIVPPNDAPALARAVLDTLDRRDTFDPDHLRASVVERFGAAAVARQLADLYERLASETRTGRPLRSGAAAAASPGRAAPIADPAAGPSPAPSIAAASPAAPASPIADPAGRPSPAAPIAEPAARPASGGRDTVIVGFTTYRTQKILSTMPSSALRRARVLCATSETTAALEAVVPKLTVVDLDRSYRAAMGAEFLGRRPASMRIRALRALRDPVGIVRRRWIRARRDRYRLAEARAALAATITAMPAGDLAQLDVVAVDGLDFRVVSLVPSAAARLVPGGLRWLADQAASRA
jgi:glycosyltransferase involved in cell wall biosynthesis